MSVLFMYCYMRTKKSKSKKTSKNIQYLKKIYFFRNEKKDIKNYKNENEAVAAHY